MQLLPNPATNNVAVIYNFNGNSGTIVLYDIAGQQILNQKLEAIGVSQNLDIEALSSGVYFYKALSNDGNRFEGKLTIVK